MVNFPTLYKKTSTGAIQYWTISVERACGPQGSGDWRGVIITEYGQLGTESPQKTEDTISEGKNKGKKNETSAFQQAEAEAKAKWEKQKKKGYVETKKAAEAEETDDLIEGGIVPMLAHKFSEHGHKIKYPAAAQPKLDGIRCIAILKDGRCTLWSRTRKPITSMPHIIKQIEEGFPAGTEIILDGELYNHQFKKDFEKIVSAVRKEKPEEGYELVEYHVYDVVTDEPFSRRMLKLRYMKSSWFEGSIVKVDTWVVENEDQVTDVFEKFRADGYEGAMLRNLEGKYANKRSYDLQKVKEFDDDEFPIVGFEEGRGKLAGHVGSFLCRTKSGKDFLAKMRGETSRLKEFFDNHSLWTGKLLTVQYQGLTGAEKVPRFPVGLSIRDYE